jgi:hypothetical protein
MRRHRRSRRKASLTERARCYSCPVLQHKVSRRVIARFFRLIIGGRSSSSTGESASSGRRCGAACRQHFAQILGVPSRRYRRRTDQIAEHDRELVALSAVGALRCGRGLA